MKRTLLASIRIHRCCKLKEKEEYLLRYYLVRTRGEKKNVPDSVFGAAVEKTSAIPKADCREIAYCPRLCYSLNLVTEFLSRISRCKVLPCELCAAAEDYFKEVPR